MSSSFMMFLNLFGAETIGTILIAGLTRLFMARQTFQENIRFFMAPFALLFVKGLLISFLVTHEKSVSNTTVLISFLLDCVAAAWILGGVLGVFKLMRVTLPLLSGLSAGFLGVGMFISWIEGFGGIFHLIGSGYLAFVLCLTGAALFSSPALRTYRPMILWGVVFALTGLAYTLSLFVASFPLLLAFWGLAVAVGFIAVAWANHWNYQVAEQSLRAERRKISLFVNASPFPILLSRLPDGQVLYTNAEAQRLFGLDAHDLKYFNFSSYFTNPQDRSRLFDILQKEAVVNDFEVKIENGKTGMCSWLSVDARAVEIEDKVALYTTFRDITGKKGKEQRLLKEALTDALTGLYNRRQFDIMAEKYIHIAKRNSANFCLLMLDIDHFKAINDTYGHDAGDAVLVKLADTLKSITRESDILARYGGEEFVLFMPNTTQQEAYFAAERLRNAIENMKMTLVGEERKITVSVGLSGENVFDLKQMIKQADVALYIAKESGRNRTAFYEMDSEDI